jgi:hypothetical protein
LSSAAREGYEKTTAEMSATAIVMNVIFFDVI